MELSTVVEDPHVARRAFLEYRELVRTPLRERASEAERELAAIDRDLMRAYRQLAKGFTLIRLSETVAAGGLEQMPVKDWRGEPNGSCALPRVAVCSAAARRVWTQGVSARGDLRLSWALTSRNRELSVARDKSVFLEGAFAPAGHEERRTSWNETYGALVPTVPPEFRPPVSRLGGYHVLFEAAWEREPRPADPALLKHVGGDLWAVLATWDLSPLEAAVLGQRR